MKKSIRYIIGIIIVISIWELVIHNINISRKTSKRKNQNKISENLIMIKRISDNEILSIPSDRLIYFYETSNRVNPNGEIIITPRQACSIESAARLNPDSFVFLLYIILAEYADKEVFAKNDELHINVLYSYNNFRIRRVDLKLFMHNTPLEEWYKTGKLETSNHRVSHTSDVLRFLTLWKYGGLYLDLDVIIMQNISALGENFVVMESDTDLASSVMRFGRSDFAFNIGMHCLMELENTFRGDLWAYNGPLLITRVLEKICKVENISKMKNKKCHGFSVLPKETFYPVYWVDWLKYFDVNATKEVLELAKESYGVHIWNKLSENVTINKGEEIAYMVFAKRYCPHIYKVNKNKL